VTVSIGLASPGGGKTDPEKVIKAADKKLYTAKKRGRNRTVY
jgi:diguanylate cyclase (GGDEF)-like protein